MADVQLDVRAFYSRLSHLFGEWAREEARGGEGEEKKQKKSSFKAADALCVPVGVINEDELFQRYLSIHLWLLGYEVPNSLLLFCREEKAKGVVHIVTTPSVIKKLAALQQAPSAADIGLPAGAALPRVEFIERAKDREETYSKCLEVIRSHKLSGDDSEPMRVGLVAREKKNIVGPFALGWISALEAANVDQVDVGPAWSDVLMEKDAVEQKHVKTSAAISAQVMIQHFIKPMERAINDDEVVTHAQFAGRVDRLWDKAREISPKLNPEFVEAAFPTIVQSGGEYEVVPGKQPDSRRLHYGCIVAALGARYRNYCSVLGRTFFVNPSKQQVQTYKTVHAAQQAMIAKLSQNNVTMADVYQAGRKTVEDASPGLVRYLTEEFGHGIGLEFQERAYTFSPANNRTVRPGMVFNLSIGVMNVPTERDDADTQRDRRAQEFSIFLADTVCVEDAGNVSVWTEKANRDYSKIRYYLEDEEDEEEDGPVSAGKAAASDGDEDMEDARKRKSKPERNTAIPSAVAQVNRSLRASTLERVQQRERFETFEGDVQKHQELLAVALRKRLEKQFHDVEEEETAAQKIKSVPKSYPKGPSQFPPEARRNNIIIDTQHDSVLLPIYGNMVPFHIATIKNVQQDEQFLRVNFSVPLSTSRATTTGAAGDMLAYAQQQNPDAIFVKEALFRVPDERMLSDLVRKIKGMRRTFTDLEKEREEVADLVEQEPLIINRRASTVPKLQDVFIRPNITQRRTIGHLEAHVNGFRFSSLRSDAVVDILYKNVRYAFEQKAENDYLVIMHFHLKNPIMLGKKKVQDVQFCTEVTEMSQALDARSARHGNDDIAQEQHERRMKQRANQAFARFSSQVRDLTANTRWPIDPDSPYRDLAFQGVPFRSRVLMTPTVHCLVSLQETPFFVLPLESIEIASLERVEFGHKLFDITFVLKDYSKPVVQVNAVDMSQLENVKKWLDEVDIKFFVGKSNYNWNQIMSEVRKDPLGFHEAQGFWGFLDINEADEGDLDEEEEVDADFAEVSSDDDEFSASDSSEGSLVSEHSSEEYSEEGASESGEDWDELEEDALKEDKQHASKRRERGDVYDSDEETRSKRAPKRARR